MRLDVKPDQVRPEHSIQQFTLPWTNPKSLGPEINNGLAHRWGEYVTPVNKYLIYSYGHGPEDCALYWVRFDNLLKNLKHSNFEPYVKDSIAAQTAAMIGQLFERGSYAATADDAE